MCRILCSRARIVEFQIRIGEIEGESFGNSFGKEAIVEQLAISKGIAGESMQLEPGVMRELHWHATAAEWVLVLKGRVRTTAINPAGQTETNDHVSGMSAFHPTPEESTHRRHCSLAPKRTLRQTERAHRSRKAARNL